MKAATTLNLPSFNTNNFYVWFLQLQTIFKEKKITSQRLLYYIVLDKLPTQVAIEVACLLESLPQDQRYDTLKQAVIKRIGKSDETKLRDLFK